jgi:Rps23 Pro-64 3,4-dihydroxylase Tpa1-like proline 4-hydroxylase
MTTKQILDAFSEGLMRDERILNARERELLTSLLQNAREASCSNPETQAALNTAIARSVGETVAQRAFTVLGGSILDQIVARGAGLAGSQESNFTRLFGGPGPGTGPQPPSGPHDIPGQPPRPPQPPSGPPSPGINQSLSAVPLRQSVQPNHSAGGAGVALLDSPDIARAECVILDEFLAPLEMEELISYTLEHEKQFMVSSVVSPTGESGMADYNHRRSRVLMELGPHEMVVLHRVQKVLPMVLEQLGMQEFSISRTEAQITASNDGDFFRAHCDDAQEIIASRRMTFVYFFHREPKQFEGGELRLHDSQTDGTHPLSVGSYHSIVPQQNQIVFFSCSTLHEITPVQCRSRAFADSRFTVNGWLHQ